MFFCHCREFIDDQVTLKKQMEALSGHQRVLPDQRKSNKFIAKQVAYREELIETSGHQTAE